MRKFFRRLSALCHRRRLQRELEEEMAAHREMMPADRQQHFGSTLRFQEEVAPSGAGRCSTSSARTLCMERDRLAALRVSP